ncbi:MAG: pre-peptidase C-terminal domain-containing protein [Candidatus Thorarchaeota archaeon]
MGINEKYKRGIFLIFLLFSIISGTKLIQYESKNNDFDDSTLSTSAPEDFYEPNNDPLSAYDLTMYELTWLSMINGPGAQWDDDWYKIMVSPGEERLIVKLIFKHFEGDIDLEIYNSSISWIASSTDVVDGEFIDIEVPSGQYYIKVYYANMGNQYDLLWDDISPSLIDDFYEENDGPGTPYIISSIQGKWLSQINGLGIQADDDWFEIYINPGHERLIVDCIFSNESGNIDLDIYNSSLVRITESWTDQNHENIDFVLPKYGVYYIRLHYGNGNNTYDLRWNTFIPGDDLFEENDDYWSACWVDPNYYSGLMIVDFDEDWFQIYLNHGDQIVVNIYFSNTQGNLQLELYDPIDSMSYRIGSHSNITDSEYISFIADYSGDWRIRVYHEDKNSTVPYDLDIWRYSGDDWAEENDDFWSAWWIDPGYYGGLMIIGGDEDWFKTYLEVGDIINVKIYFDHNIGDLELELFHPDYYHVMGSYISTPTHHEEFISFKVQDPGEWRIKIYQVSGASEVYYDLEIWIDKREPQRDDPYEWNDYPDIAYYLGDDEETWLSEIHGLAVSGDEDWYKITITPGFHHLIMDLKFNNSLGNIDISVEDRWGWFIENRSRTSVDDIDINCAVPHPGDYFVRIFGDFLDNKYDLAWDDLRTDFRPDDNYEDNDDASSAYDLTHQIEYWDDYEIKGRTLFDINDIGIQSDNDWFKIHLEPGIELLQLEVFLSYEYSEGAIGIALYDSDLTKLEGNFTMEDNEFLKYVLPSNGTYFIRLYGENYGSPYDFMWRLRENPNQMIPGYDIFILLGGIIGVSTIITVKWKRSKNNL